MAAALVGGGFLSASLQVLFDRLASPKVVDFFKGRKLNSELLENLKITMISVGGLLGDAEEKQITKDQVRNWLDELKDAVYEADDLLAEIAYAALSSEMEAGPQNSIDRFPNFIPSQGPLEEMESKLREIDGKFKDLLDEKNALGLKEGIGKMASSKPTTSLMDESVVYCSDEDNGVIIQLLLSDDANCNKLVLIPIVSVGWVGKSTLAESIYNDSRVKERFCFQAWIDVSVEFDVLKVTKNILNRVSTRKLDFNTLNTLEDFQVALKNELTDKKFLLVLDDVRSDSYDHWNLLLKPLEAGAKGSKIIVTTRLQSVASVIEDVHIIEVHIISEECWALFSERAFEGMNSSERAKFEEIGRKIVKNCNNLPLAAKSLGSLLRRTQRKPEEWDRVLKNDIWNLPKDNIPPALRLSYHFLPSHLKQCFAYCAIFPRQYVFKKDELVLLWMGEGFLDQARISMEREVTGEECFDDLVSRSFFDPRGEDWFSMDYLFNDLARSVAGEYCFRLDDHGGSCKVPPRTRHLRYVLRNGLLSKISEDIESAPLLRTFLLADRPDDYAREEVIKHALIKFERLRVLSLSLRWRVNKLKLDDSISNLKHLRYLNLSSTLFIRILPESLCSLYHLEILLLRYCRRLVELPLNLGNLVNLCVLDITDTFLQKMPPHMGKLKKLQKLSYFVIGEESKSSIQELGNLPQSESRIQELGDLEQLRGCLVIRNLQNVKNVGEASSANIQGKMHLKELNLDWKGVADYPQGDDGVADHPQGNDGDPEHDISLLEQLKPHENVETLTISGYGGIEFPNWFDGISGLLGVVTLKLHGCRNCCRLPPLGQLVHLKQLFITDFPNIVLIGSEFYGRCTPMRKPFQSLEVLRFQNMPHWQEWVMCENEEVFHLLQKLHIINCPAFEQSLPQLPSLIKLEIRGCVSLVASLPSTRGFKISLSLQKC